ncbi:tRNA cytosine(34) acetyltransferase TmcA, partial [Salmonella enterica subsp. enterica serovar Kentucky]|nr:tRNA cytosine(34) acetyltransferase TmcA [Salmonella enterica subsp. enterica serovar Kentucky]
MSDIDALQALTSQMTQEGIRRLLVISGDAAWCRERAEAIRAALPGDWLWVAPDAPAQPRCTPQALQTLLGREFRHAIFDAWQGFDAAAFAALSGTLQAGSWLLLLMPPYETWESRPDTDSLRWSDCAQPIPTPQFAQHLKRTLSRDPQTLLWRQRQPFCWPSYPFRGRWRPATGEPQPEQAAILSRLREMPPGVATVIAPRGR